MFVKKWLFQIGQYESLNPSNQIKGIQELYPPALAEKYDLTKNLKSILRRLKNYIQVGLVEGRERTCQLGMRNLMK